MKEKRRPTYAGWFYDGRHHKDSRSEHGKIRSNKYGSLQGGSKVKWNDGGGME